MKKINFIAAILLFSLFFFFFKVNASQFAIVTQFGSPKRIILTPGLYFKLPSPIQTVKFFDRRLQVYTTRMIEHLTQDKKNIILECFVVWKIKEPLLFFQAVADTTSAEQRIDDIVCSQIGGILGITPLSSLISTEEDAVKIPGIESLMTKEVNFKAIKDYGIEINSISISRLALPEDNVKSVITRMITERKAIANKYRAEGMEEAVKIKSQAEREKSDILSTAYQESQSIIGKGDAEAMQVYSEAYAKDPEFYEFLRTLESYKKILNDKTTIVIPSDSKFLRYLDSPFLKEEKLK